MRRISRAMLPAAVALVSAVATAAPEARGFAYDVLAAPASRRSACPASGFAALAAAGFSTLAFRTERGDGGGTGATGRAGVYDALLMCAASNTAFIVVTGPASARARAYVDRVRLGFNPRALSSDDAASYASAPGDARVFRSFDFARPVASCRSSALRALEANGFTSFARDATAGDRAAIDGERGPLRALFMCSAGFATALLVTGPSEAAALGVSTHLFQAFASGSR